jgi:signal transduction histidine kinase
MALTFPLPWRRSLYWRIGITFVALVLVVLVVQSVMFGYILVRANLQDPDRSPNNVATTVAADLRAALEKDPHLDLDAYLSSRYGSEPWNVFVVMRSGDTAGNSASELSDELRRSAEVVFRGEGRGANGDLPRLAGPVVTAPVVVGTSLEGLVVLPPPPPPGVMREVGRLLSLPGSVVLILATIVTAVLAFGPARRRLSALEEAAERLGDGDLTARAPEDGGDEIARLARAFNRMAGELSSRDEALRTSDRLRRQMLADVSHELRTPLTAMRGYIETLRIPELSLDQDQRARYFETIENETRRLDRIVRDLLDLARFENGVTALEVRVFAAERVFQHVARRHEREARERGVDIRLEVAAADQIVGDPDRIEQAIDNLTSNALRHTPRGGAIDLRAHVGAGAAVLSVVDAGSGIAPEHLPHVFERFYKADTSRAGNAGSGLGLSIAKAIAERHGGSISVASAPGRTEFTIVLPQSQPPG